MKTHHTRGVYANGDYKDNAVAEEDLQAHIEYNKAFRPGRALIVDGVVVYNGFLTDEQLSPHVGVVRQFTAHSRPYH